MTEEEMTEEEIDETLLEGIRGRRNINLLGEFDSEQELEQE